MAIRLVVILFVYSGISFSQGIETQRKYRSDDMQLFKKFIASNDSLMPFKIYSHQEYTSQDIYFDTPENDLFNNGLSLRFRQKPAENGFTYSLQLKTEMTSENGIRVEVDEPELDFYQMITDTLDVPLIQILERLFICMNYNKETRTGCQEWINPNLKYWFKQKANAPIAPFQKLIYLLGNIFTEEKFNTLEPVCYGESKRIRSHVYIDLKDYQNEFGRLYFNPESVKENFNFFIDNESKIWVLESSLDSSVFDYLIADKPKVMIEEYEVETKYHMDEIANKMIDSFESLIIKKFDFHKGVDSKFRQSMNQFLKKD